MEWLKNILENEELTAEQKQEAIQKELPKSFIPKQKYNEKVEELNATAEKMEELKGQVENLSKSSEEADKLKEQLENIKGEFDTFKTDSEKRVLNIQKKQAIERGLSGANANPDTIDLLTGLFDIEKLQLNSKGDIVDWEEHLNPIKETRQSLFGKVKVNGDEPHKGGGEPLDVSDFSKLTSEQRMQLRESNPERYNQLRKEYLNK